MNLETAGYIVESLVLPLTLVALLIVTAAQDLKTKEVSNWLTVFPLLVGVAWRAMTGGWELLIAFVIITLFSERIVSKSRSSALTVIVTGFVATFYFLPASPSYWTLFGWLAAWLLWEFNVIGGADVKLMMMLLVVYPRPEMFFLILLAKLAAGLVVPAFLYGRRALKRLASTFFLVLVARQTPDRETLEREGLPAAFVYTMAGVGYVLAFEMQSSRMQRVQSLRTTLGDPMTWGALLLAFVLGSIPPAIYIVRSVNEQRPDLSPAVEAAS